ncbi:hypothetical protein ACSBR2_032118 [Camellia fascicularis]
MVTVKVKGRSAVLESSALQDSGHIHEDGKSIYNTTLNMTDHSTGVNIYHILQIIQEDKGSGFEALTEIHNLLNSNVHNASYKESLIVDASNFFFTLIPSIHPHVITDKDDFKSKTGFDVHNKESLDEKYKKLRCDIAPLPHDSNDYLLIENYLQTTHAPTHTIGVLNWKKFFRWTGKGNLISLFPTKKNRENRMPLWRGSHLTNFVGILSQGLRIAPPEAPATGYMLGKGVYFADLVSKST